MIDQLFMQDLAKDLAPPLEPVEQPATLLAAGPATSDVGQVTVQGFKGTEPQPEMGVARPIPRNKAQEALGYLGDMLTKAGVQLDKVGIDIPALGRLTLKDLTVGESGRVLEDMSYGFMPVEGAGGFISGTTRIKPDEALELLNIAPAVGALAKAGGKAAVKGVTKAVESTKGLPVGMSIQDVGQGVDELGFYSAARQAVDAIQQPKGTGDQFLKQIEKTPGVKPDEIKWTGLDDFLKSKKTVTKAEVQEYLDKNKVEIKEVQLGGIKLNEKSEYALPEVLNIIKENQGSSFDGIRLALVNDYKAYNALTKKFPNLEETDNWQDRVLEDIIGAGGGGTKFSKFTVPGGENYREIYMTLPPKTVSEEEARAILGAAPDAKLSEADIFYASRKKQDDYIVPRAHSSGMNEGDINRIAHLRVNDRVVDGKKTLFVEEVQSDWHQQGRKQGYKDPAIKDEYQALEKELMAVNREALPYTSKGEDAPQNLIEKKVALSERMDALDRKYRQAVPDAPFKTTWSELSMKRAIQMASEGGYDRIAFTTGKTQAERYDLSKEISDLTITRNKTDFSISAVDKNGNPVIGRTIPDLRNLDEYVGKDLAEKVKDDFANKSGSEHVYSGLDLQVGGEGMKGFYDDILPKFLNKYGKKWDAKVGKTEIDADGKKEPVSYIDITPKMRESTLTKGQPMFAIGAGGAGAAATQQEENK